MATEELTPAEKASIIAQKQYEIYTTGVESGKQSAYNAFWDVYQSNGTRKDYTCAFGGVGWTNDTFRPKYNIILNDAYMLFRMSKISGDLVEILAENGVALDFSRLVSALFAFSYTSFTRLGVIDLSKLTTASAANYLFQYSSKLETIDRLILPPTRLSFGEAFDGCKALENLTIEGTIQYNFNVQSCPLTHDSLMSIINALGDGLSYTLTLGAANIAKLTEEEILIAENKGWTIA